MKKVFLVIISLLIPGLSLAANTLPTPLQISNLYPSAGNSVTVSGNCGVSAENSSINLSLLQNGNYTPLPSASTLNADGTGQFTTTVTFPPTYSLNYSSGPATIVATCNTTGDVINSPTITFATPASTAFGSASSTPAVGGLYSLTGSCGASNGSGTADLSFTSNGSNTYFGTFNLNPTGTFNNSVNLPSTATPGQGTLTAKCSNGTTFSSNITLAPTAVNSFFMSANPTLGSTGTISGTCANNSNSGATSTGSSTSFSLIRNGVTTPLSTSSGISGGSAFNSTVTYPTGYGSGPATLVVTCADGSTYATQISLADASSANLPSNSNSGSSVSMPNPTPGLQMPSASNVAAANMTPVGGVNAGTPPQNPKFLLLGLLLSITAVIGLLAKRGVRLAN